MKPIDHHIYRDQLRGGGDQGHVHRPEGVVASVRENAGHGGSVGGGQAAGHLRQQTSNQTQTDPEARGVSGSGDRTDVNDNDVTVSEDYRNLDRTAEFVARDTVNF